MVPEPSNVYPEAAFQKALVVLIEDILKQEAKRFVLLQTFGLDIAVFIGTAGASSAVRLFEVKAFGGQRMGGVGFGNKQGGSQVDLLLCQDSDFGLLDPSIRWAYADALQAPGAKRYALLTCAAAKKAAMGGVVRGKQNNLRVAALRDSLVDWSRFQSDVTTFLLGS